MTGQKNNLALLRVVIAGSVDDGKSTMIGRLLYDSHAIYEDQITAVQKQADLKGEKELDFSLFTDGLAAEREQNITIDVAYRHLITPRRRFIFADVPGHVQYTRNMATGASGADVAIILVDAQKGAIEQTHRHLYLAYLFGIRDVVVLVNKMDSVNYQQDIFESIKKAIEFFVSLGLAGLNIKFIPASALRGEMIRNRGNNLDWYKEETLLEFLEKVKVSPENFNGLRLPIQMVLRSDNGDRAYAGKVIGGLLQKGDKVLVMPSGEEVKIQSILVGDKEETVVEAPRSMAVTLSHELDISRGDMLVEIGNTPKTLREITAFVCWFGREPLSAGREFFLKHTAKTTRCRIEQILYEISVDDLSQIPVKAIPMNSVGLVRLTVLAPLFVDSYDKNKETGSFVIIDEATNNTAGGGMIKL